MHIAVVEDEKQLADSIREGLEMEGHAVDVFYEPNTTASSSHFHASEIRS